MDTDQNVTQVGTYEVNQDCTITVALSDVFSGAPVTPPGTSGATSGETGGAGSGTGESNGMSASFEGVVSSDGNNIELAEAGTSTGVTVEMRKMLQTFGCTDASLTGPFVFSTQLFSSVPITPPGTNGGTGTGGTGAGATGESTAPSFPLVGRFYATGQGALITDSQAQNPVLPALQLTGTYTVNPDCTGTATFTSATGVTRNVNFVIVQSNTQANGGICAATAVTKPELLFSFGDPGVNGFGTARQP
jgi:hypothetical protein